MLNDQLIIALSLVISFLFILNLILTIYLACFKRAIFGRPITISHRSANAELPGTNHGFVVERSEKSALPMPDTVYNNALYDAYTSQIKDGFENCPATRAYIVNI